MASKNNTSQQKNGTFLGKGGTDNPLEPPQPQPSNQMSLEERNLLQPDLEKGKQNMLTVFFLN